MDVGCGVDVVVDCIPLCEVELLGAVVSSMYFALLCESESTICTLYTGSSLLKFLIILKM